MLLYFKYYVVSVELRGWHFVLYSDNHSNKRLEKSHCVCVSRGIERKGEKKKKKNSICNAGKLR